MDDMPVASMFDIITDDKITVQSKKQAVALVKKYDLPKHLEKHDLHTDELSYWFVDPSFKGNLRRKTRRRRKSRKTRR
jgi:hypothetical protein